MMYIFLAFILVFGTLIGSFLNVVILRYNTGKNLLSLGSRSMCFCCGKQLSWYELIPVVSFIFLRAKCSGCKSKISWQYPFVELAMGALTLAIFLKNFHGIVGDASLFFLTIFQIAIWGILLVITVYDFRHKIIPDSMVFTFAFLALVVRFLFPDPQISLMSAIVGGVVFFSFFGLLWFFSGGRWLGFGDAKLVLGVGLLLGFSGGLSALALSFWIGAAISILLIGFTKLMKLPSIRKVVQRMGLRTTSSILTMKSEIPFAPFIILGTLIVFFCHADVFVHGSFF